MEVNSFYAADDFTGEQCVLLSDHIASHAYDEAKERELFCLWSSMHEYLGGCTLHTGTDGLFADVDLQCAWESWKACAKSRDRSAE